MDTTGRAAADRRDRADLPSSTGERFLQSWWGTSDRAEAFYRDQMLDVLTPRMVEFLSRQTQLIVASAAVDGHPDVSVRFGDPGFVAVLDGRTVAWPELRGNGVLTTLGNFVQNPWAHLMFLDSGERIGLHLRGEVELIDADAMADEHPDLAAAVSTRRAPQCWVVLHLATSYVHCRKHFPAADAPLAWAHDDVRAKGRDYFGAEQVASPWAPTADSRVAGEPAVDQDSARSTAAAR